MELTRRQTWLVPGDRDAAVARNYKSVLPPRLDWLSLLTGHEQRQTHWLSKCQPCWIQEVRGHESIS